MPKRPQRPRKPARKPQVLLADSDVPGLPARRAAADVLLAVLRRQRPLDEALAITDGFTSLPDRDRALVRMLTATALRRLGTLRALIGGLMEKALPADAVQVEIALLLGAAQILFLDVPDHAAVDLSVRLTAGPRNGRYAGLVNAVLRRVTREGRDFYASIDPALDAPGWLRDRWDTNYGGEVADAIMQAHRSEPPLDITAKSDATSWAEKLGGILLPNGTIRVGTGGNVANLPGFAEGEWWVQDVAASIPVRLLGDVAGKRVADLCAAPGGKTAQLAKAGAEVIAVDRSPKRAERLKENLARLGLQAEIVVADAAEWNGGPFDAVLLDAPCTATGTIRRHPDLPWQKQPADLATLSSLQTRLLDRAANLTKSSGLLVYATCSLEPEEGERQIESFLGRHADFAAVPVAPQELTGLEVMLTPDGMLRSLPCHLAEQGGSDGFFAARLRRNP
jgi:16S rRNA (cytosine967-C5)-methyltransferase